jgi:hypothetical protein
MMGEMAASTLFRGMASGTKHPVFSEMFHKIGRDESRHLQICMTILGNEWPGELDIEGVDMSADIDPEDIIPVF